jgi:4-amino-4-deoxy-L-arabinose transferase-like glycosyltransferase
MAWRPTGAQPRWKDWGFAWWLTLWTALGLVIRVLTVLGRPNRVPAADAFYYSGAANLLVQGKGFINPYLYYWAHQSVPSAQFPPGFVFTLAAASLVGFTSFFAHRMWCAILGAVAVAVCGLAGREIGGRRVGLITAFLVAVYPNIWMSDEMALSETITPLVVALVLLAAYRLWKGPSLKTAVAMGLALGVAVLTRDELSLLGLVVVVPMVLRAGSVPWRRRALILATVALSAVPIVLPWVAFNMSRFRDPVYVSTGLGPTLASTDCAQVWSGPLIGYWSWPCEQAPPPHPGYDESQTSAAAKAYAMRYVHAHESRLPVVALARIGRGFALFHPFQEIHLDASESRPVHWALAGLWMYFALLPLAVVGAVALNRRGVTLLPLAGVAFTVVVSMVLAFGNTRYRIPFEVCLLVLAAAGIDWIWGRSRRDGGRVLAEATDRAPFAGVGAGGPVDRAPEGPV